MMKVITSKEVSPYVVLDTSAAKDIVSCELQDKVRVIDAKKGTYVIEKEVVETSRISTQDYIDSFKDDVGIENILKKFELVKDPELFNQVNRPTVSIEEDGKESVQDYTGIPSDEEAALVLAKKAQLEFDALPPELVKGRSFNEFAETCSKEELLTFLTALQSSQVNKKDGE